MASTSGWAVASSSSSCSRSNKKPFPILCLPHCAFFKVLGYLPYHQVAQLRLVCKTFDEICQQQLNQGFQLMIRMHSKMFKEIVARSPKRESERKLHPLKGHYDVLKYLQSVINISKGGFSRFISLKLCCFIPGKLIDEILKTLRILKNEEVVQWSILTEIIDIYPLAHKHFMEEILPQLKTKAPKLSPLQDQVEQLAVKFKKIDDDLESLKETFSTNDVQSKELASTKRLLKIQAKKLREQAALLKVKDNEIKDMNARLLALETLISEKFPEKDIPSLKRKANDSDKDSKKKKQV